MFVERDVVPECVSKSIKYCYHDSGYAYSEYFMNKVFPTPHWWVYIFTGQGLVKDICQWAKPTIRNSEKTYEDTKIHTTIKAKHCWIWDDAQILEKKTSHIDWSDY